jgi:hypothetical protein
VILLVPDELDLGSSLATVQRHVTIALSGELTDQEHFDELVDHFLPKFIPVLLKAVERYAAAEFIRLLVTRLLILHGRYRDNHQVLNLVKKLMETTVVLASRAIHRGLMIHMDLLCTMVQQHRVYQIDARDFLVRTFCVLIKPRLLLTPCYVLKITNRNQILSWIRLMPNMWPYRFVYPRFHSAPRCKLTLEQERRSSVYLPTDQMIIIEHFGKSGGFGALLSHYTEGVKPSIPWMKRSIDLCYNCREYLSKRGRKLVVDICRSLFAAFMTFTDDELKVLIASLLCSYLWLIYLLCSHCVNKM